MLPLTPHPVREPLRGNGAAQNVVPDFSAVLPVALRVIDGDPDGLQSRPPPPRSIWELLGHRTHPVVARLVVTVLVCVVSPHLGPREIAFEVVLKSDAPSLKSQTNSNVPTPNQTSSVARLRFGNWDFFGI